MRFVVWLHIAAAIFLLGPLTVVTMATPRAIRQGAEGLPLLRWFHRTTRGYGLASLLVFALGAAAVPLAPTADRLSFGTGWLSAAMGIFLVGFLLLVIVARDQRKALGRIETGEGAAVESGRIAALAGVAALLWVVVLALMVWKPGGAG